MSEGLEEHRTAAHARALRWVKDPAEAEDLTQEALLRAHNRIESLKDPKAVLAWVLRITDRLCIDRLRRRDPLRLGTDGAELEAVDVPDAAPNGLQRVEQEEMSACTRKYLERLNPGHRRVLWLHDVDGLSAKEIASALGVSEGAAKIRVHRARQNLRALLQGACQLSTDERGILVCEPKASPRSK